MLIQRHFVFYHQSFHTGTSSTHIVFNMNCDLSNNCTSVFLYTLYKHIEDNIFAWVEYLPAVVMILIVIVNIPILSLIFAKPKITFIDILIATDCLLCVCNCIILLKLLLVNSTSMFICLFSPPIGYFINICKRLLTIVIVIYRYVFVFKNSWVGTENQRKNFTWILAGCLFIATFSGTICCIIYKDKYLFYLG